MTREMTHEEIFTSTNRRAEWVDDKAWADTWRPLILEILRPIAGELITIRDATTAEDRSFGFDYVLRFEGGAFACRIRKPGCDYRDVTIRSYRPSGVPTEIDKLPLGYADFYFYGWSNNAGTAFADFIVFDIPRFLAAGLLDDKRDIPNGDGTKFRAVPSAQVLAVAGCALRSSRTLLPALTPPGQTSLLHGGRA